VSLTATPSPGHRFDHWSGGATGTANPVSVTLTADTHVTAILVKLFTLTTSVVGPGTLEVSPLQTYYEPGTVVRLTPTPGPDTFFDYWEGNIEPGGDPHVSRMRLTMTDDLTCAAHFLERPGLSQIDMIQDMEDFLVLIGESADCATWDINDITYDEDVERVYSGNGMPDAVELYLIERILKARWRGLTVNGGISHDATWDAWIANLTQVQADLPKFPETVHRIVAGYMTNGTFESTAAIQYIIEDAWGVTLDYFAYERNRSEHLGGDKDADRDGVSNISEWQMASPTGSLDDVDTFADIALGGALPGETGNS
jgi:hypothetical protein